MLSISKPIRGAAQCEYYLNLASLDDYYLDREEPPGFWLGDGAQALGLKGQVAEDEFRNLFRGFSPDGYQALVRNTRSFGRRCGWDLTWSAPKSVSTFWSQAPQPVRLQVEAALRDAVREGVQYLEGVGILSRRGEDGVIRDPARLILAAYLHSTSRLHDPQLHIHTVLMNVGVRPDGSTGTLDPREMFRHQHAAGAVFRADLAAQLETRLGLRAVREGRSFELLGVDRELMETFSKRRFEILSKLEEKGLSGAKAAEIAAFATRTRKTHIPRAELFETWQAIGRAHHWTRRNVELLVGAPFPPRNRSQENTQAGRNALDSLTDHESHFSLRQLTQALAEEAQGRGLGAQDIHHIREALVRSGQAIRVGERRRERQFSTPEMIAIERELLEAAARLKSAETCIPGIDAIIDDVVSRHPELSAEQRQAVLAVTQSFGGLQLISGMAGTGKTFSFRVAREAWEAEGLTVHGASLSGKAAAGLEEGSGIRSQTLHRLLWGIQQGAITLGTHSVVLIDEAAMVGTRQLRDIVDACERARAKLVLAGDAGQLQPIEAGGAFGKLALNHGSTSLTEIRRQREEWARDAVKDFAAGRAARALTAFLERGRVDLTGSPSNAEKRLVADWTRSAVSDPASAAIFAGTNAEVARLNSMVQEIRRDAGYLRGEPLIVSETPLFVGDRVLFTRNSPALGIFNGEPGIVTEVSRSTLTVVRDHGPPVTIDTTAYPHLALAYAFTTHKSQGMTVSQAFVLTGSMQCRELTYVQASRAREATRFYVGGEQLEQLTDRMEQSKAKEMAVTLTDTREPSLELGLRR